MLGIVCYEHGEWTAVYLDGELQCVGDSYLADEWIRTYFGINTIQDDAFLLGGSSRSSVAKSVADIDEYVERRERGRQAALKFRQQAAELIAQAEQLEA